jgi:hypothetical protein
MVKYIFYIILEVDMGVEMEDIVFFCCILLVLKYDKQLLVKLK